MSFFKARPLIFCSVFAAALVSLTGARPAFAEFKISGGGKAECVIIRQPGATEEEAKAAAELAKILEEVTGAKFSVQIAASAADIPSAAIVVGLGKIAEQAFPEVAFDRLEAGQIVMRTKGQKLLLAGAHPSGTLNAVYKFLQDFAGCRWWTPWAATIPRKSELSVPEINLTEKPAFEMRMVGWFYALNDKEWQARNLINECDCPDWVHTFYKLVPPDVYFEKHPEWYGLINGERSRTAQLCLSNKELRAFVAEQVGRKIDDNPRPPRFISVSQMDWERACDCESCRSLVKRYGSQSGALIDFVNEIASAVKVKHPETKIHTLAYNYTEPPPKDVKADEQVIVQFCPINRDHSVGLDASENELTRRELRGWSGVAGNLYVWDYPANLGDYALPHPNWFLLGDNLRHFEQNGVKGVYIQGAFNSNGGEMAELRSWLYARLLWNPNQDDNALIDEFLAGYYGEEASPFIRQYLELMRGNNKDFKLTPFPDASAAPFLRFESLSRAEELFNKAEEAVQSDGEKLWRVRRAHLPVKFAFIRLWDRLQAEAQTLNKPWLFNVSREEYARQWFDSVNEDGPRGWIKPTNLGEMTRLNKETMAEMLNPPQPPSEKHENFPGDWLSGWLQRPTFLLWSALIPLLSIACLKNEPGRNFGRLKFLSGAAFVLALAVYTWWQPFWTGRRLLILFVFLAASIFFSVTALLMAEYRRGLKRLIAAQLLAGAVFTVGLGWWLKPYFTARYQGFQASLPKANLSRANLYSTNLEGVNLEGANLKDSYFRGSWLGFADLRHTDLRNADFRHSTLNGTLFDFADLRGADLRGAGIAIISLKGAKYNRRTLFPVGFDPSEYGAIYEE